MKLILIAAATIAIAAPAFAQDAAAPTLPYCSAKVTDSCQQTAAQQARAMTGEQAAARDAKTGTWTPNTRPGSTSTKTKTTVTATTTTESK